MVNMYIHFPMHKCIGLKVIFNFLITRNWTLVYLICLNLEFAKKSFKLNYVLKRIWVCLLTTFLWQVEHESFKNIKGTSFISPHTHIQGCILVFYKYLLLLCAKGMFMVPCSKFQFVHNSNLSFKEELNIFLPDLWSKYVLCLLFLKEISRFQTTCALNICGLILLFGLN